MTPNGAAANLASGGRGPVATRSGKLAALDSARPLASFSSAGRCRAKAVRSGSGAAKRSRSTSASPSCSSSNTGGCSVLPARSRAWAAWARATGALNFSSIGRIGMQAAWAFSRSQPILAVNGSRTVKAKRRSTRLSTPPGVATPTPYTSCTRVAGLRRRLHCTVA